MGGIFSIPKKIEACETKKDHLLALNDEKKKSVKTPLKKKVISEKENVAKF